MLQDNYCGHVGFEYMHINEVEERRFIQERIEGEDETVQFTPEGKQSILTKVIHAEQWEKFLARKYVGHQALRARRRRKRGSRRSRR